MRVAVCVKSVPDAGTQRRIDPSTKRIDRSADAVINEFDTNAIEEGLRLVDAAGEGEVVLVSVGPEKALDSLRRGLAMGASRVVLVSDEAAAGSDLVATSHILAKALDQLQPDLVLFGQQSSDADGAVLGAAVADRLRVPIVSQVAELTVEGRKVRGRRQTEYGYDTIEVPLPALIAVSDAVNTPRYPSLKGIMGAKSKPQEVLSLADVGAEPGRSGEVGSKTKVAALVTSPPRGESRRIEGGAGAAATILEFLEEKNLL